MKESCPVSASTRTALHLGTLLLAGLTLAIPASAAPPSPTIVWVGPSGGNWNNTNNWSPTRVPLATDHVAINAATNVTVVLDVSASIASLALGADSGTATQRLAFNSGVGLAVGTNSVVRSLGEMVWPNGDYAALSGTGLLEVRGLLDWTGGRVWSRVSIAAGGRMRLGGGTYMRLTSGNGASPAAITNAGTVTWLGGQQLYAYDNSQIYNSGRWELAADGQVIGGGVATFYNSGTLVKTAGSGTSYLNSLSLVNSGVVAADVGTLELQSGVVSEWRAGGQIAGAGRVLMTGGSATLAGRTTLNGQWEWNSDGLAVLGAGEVGGPVPLHWTAGRVAGALTVAADGRVDLRGGYYTRLSSGVDTNPAALTNHGVVTWAGGTPLYAGYGAQIYNSGEWRLQADGTALENAGGNWATFHNDGLITKTAGAGDSAFGTSVTIQRGTVNADTGTLRFNASTEWPQGAQVTGSGRVLLASGNANLAGTITLNGSWEWGGVSISGTGAISGPVPMIWRSGRNFGNLTVNPGARLNFSGEYYPTLASSDDASPAMLTNRGTVSWPGGYPLYAGYSAQIYNHGQWRVEADGTALSYTAGGGNPTFHNFGTLTKTGGTNETLFTASSTINRGVMNVAVGTLQFNASTEWPDGGQISGAGRVLLSGGNTLLSGTTILNGSWQWSGVSISGTSAISGPVPLLWRSGRHFGKLTVNPGAQLSFSGEYYPTLASSDDANPAVLTNRGTVSWPGGYPLYAGYSAQIYNQGQWRVEADGTALSYTAGGGNPTFHNFGTLTKTGGTNETLFTASSTINRGVMNVAVGTLQFNANTEWPDGGQISGSGRVLLTGGNTLLSGNTLLNGSWQWSGVSVTGTGAISGPIPLIWRTGRLLGNLTVASNAQLNFSGEYFPTLASSADANPAILTNRGTVVWPGGNPLYAGLSARVYNLGQWRLEGGGSAFNYTIGGGPGTFFNSGTLLKTGSATADMTSFSLNNSGRVSAEAGQFTINVPPVNSGEFYFPVRGPVAGTDFGVIGIVGAYSHQGTLRVEMMNGFTPAIGQYFDVITGNALGGNFAALALPAVPPDQGWTVDYYSTLTRLRLADKCFADGLVGWWTADSGASDLTGAHNGTFVNGATTTNGFVGQAFFLDGVNDYVDLGNWSPGNRWTIQAWVKLNQIQAGRHNLFGGINENRDWALTVTDGYLGLSYRPPNGVGTTFTNAAPALTNTWYHLAGSCNGSNVALYINGALVGTAPSDPDYAPTITGLRIGSASYAVAENFAGLVDEATVHNRPLTAPEIAATYNNGTGGRCAQLGLGVLAFAPSGFVTTDVSQLRVTFNQPFQTNTFTGSDVAITGPAGGVANNTFTVQPATPFDGRTFLVNVPTLTNEGVYSVSIGPDILTIAGIPMPLAYTASFTLDKAAPRVIAFTPVSPVTNQITTMDATFSENMSGATAQAGDLTITGPGGAFATDVAQLASNRFRFTLNRPLAQGAQTVLLTGITDLAGNTMTPYTNVLSVENPDLIPGIVAAPALALAGQSINLIYAVTNAGNAAAPGPWRADFLMSTNAAGANAALLGSATVTNLLPAGSVLTLTQSIVFPPGLVGTRFLGVRVDALDVLVEAVETNNTAWAITGTAVSAPDLVVTNLAAPASVVRGGQLAVTWTRANIGSAPTFVAGQDQVFLSASSNSTAGARLLASVPGAVLNAGAFLARTQLVTLPLETTLPSGNYFLLVVADSPDAQAEGNEANNVGFRSLALTEPPLPDLSFAFFSPPTSFLPGASMEIRWAVTNEGTLGLTNAVWRERVAFSNSIVGQLTLGDFIFTNTIPAGGAITRTQAVVYPVGQIAEAGWVRVTLDFGDAIVEASEANNIAVSEAPVPVQPMLALTLTPATLDEGAITLATVHRNGDTNATVLVAVTNDWPARLTMPSQIVLTAGVSQATFTVGYPENGVPEGTRLAHIGITATNYSGEYEVLTLVDSSQTALTLTLETNRVREGFTVAAMVSRGAAGPEPLEVFLSTADPLSLTVPFSVTIPANQASFTFAVLATDDTFFNGTRTNRVRAAAVNYAESFATLMVFDDDLPVVSLALSPAVVSENGGPQAAALNVLLSAPAPRNVVLDLESSDPARARVPAAVSVSAGQVAASVPVEAIDNLFFGSNAPVLFQGFIHEAGSYQYIGQTAPVLLTILDDEGPSLTLRLDRDLVEEGLPNAAQGTVTRNGSIAAALVVTLQSSDITEATVPTSVTILAGQASVTFAVASIADGITDGAQRATITASAAGFAPASAPLTVSDLDLPDYRVASVNGPTTATAESTFSMSYRVSNQGRAPGGSNLLTKVYLRTDPLAFGGILVGSYTLPSPLPAGQFFEQSLQGRFPDRVGRYYLVVQTDADGRNAETLEDNNQLVSAPIELTAPWTATVQTPVTLAPARTAIPMTGQATRPGGFAVANTLVSIHVMHEGFLRTVAAFTDASGNFSATFQPLAGEAGFYEIGAGHPGVTSLPAEDSFNLIGLAVNPASVRVEIKEGEIATGGVLVTNLGALPLTGVAASVISGPPGWNTVLNFTNSTLPAGGAGALGFSVTPNSTGIGTIIARVTADGGVTNYLTLTVAVAPLTPRLVAEPASLFAGMVRGAQTVVNFSVVNQGGLATGPLNVSLPNVHWMRVASPNPMPALPPGGSNVVTLLLSPPADLELIPYDGALQLVAANAVLNVPFQFRALSTATGDLRVQVVDELTYYAEGGPMVSNALVILRDPQTHDAITNLNTGTNGFVDFASLTEGYYEVDVSADKHTSHRGPTFLAAGRTNDLEIFISRTLVQYIWTVVPTEIEDRTRIVIETEFETVVPLPVVTIEPAYIDLADLPEPEAQVEFRISNHGLIAAKNVAIEMPTGSGVQFDTVASDLGDLPANSSITVPVRVRFPTGGSAAPQGLRAAGGALSGSRDRCYYYIRERHEIPCGKRTNTYYTVSAIRDSKAQGCSGGGSGSSGPGGGGGPVLNGGPLSPYGTTSGPGGNAFFAPRIIPPVDEKCGCEGFVPTCLEAGGSVSLPTVKVSRFEASLKASGSGKICTCCDEDGKGTKKEINASIEGTLELKIPIPTGLPNVDASFNAGPYRFEGEFNLGGLDLILAPKLKGEYQLTEDCHGKNKRECTTVSSEATAELKASIGPKFRVLQGGQEIGVAEATISASIKGGFSAKITQCTPGKSESMVCILPVTVSAGVTVKFQTPGGSAVEYTSGVSADLIGEQCNNSPAPASVGAGGGNFAQQVADALEEALRRAREEILRKQGIQSAAAPAPAGLAPAAANPGPHAAAGGEVCARVRLRINQDLVMTRQAFDATLELINRDPITSLNNVGVNVQIFDAFGRDVTDRFGQRPPAVSGMGAVDGTGSLAPDSTGRASFILVPSREAAPEQPTVYFVGGTLSYKLGGLTLEIPLTPAPITVYPDPRLKIQYFHQRDVLSDDPFTRDVIEPTIPYSLAVMINNIGRGEAKNVRLISGQPQIIENERGLLIDFKIIATEVAGQGVTPSLTADFGRFDPGQIKIGRWLMTSTLQGLFINYSATFEHLDSLGKTNLSLVDEVTIHEMIRLVNAGGIFQDGKPDFLVNDDPDPDDLPDHIYLSDGSTNRVSVIRAASADGAPVAGDLSVTLTAAMPSGWAYLRVPDPANGAYRLARVLRSDGGTVAVDTNAWQTDRTFIGRTQRPIRENLLHLLDYDSTGSYTLIYEPLPATDFMPPSSTVAALPAYSMMQIPVSWSGTDQGGGSIARYDIYVAEDYGPFVPWLQGVPQQAGIFEGQPGRRYEFYSIATDTAGNREAPPIYADAQTVVALSNNPPSLTLNAPAAIDEGNALVITADASDPEMPMQSLLFTLLDGPAGAVINPATGRIDWQTGEGVGPSTNFFRVRARDNGLPPLSATGAVSVVVREVNSAPVITSIADRIVNEGALLTFAVSAFDPDLPKQSLSFTLGTGAPAGANIQPLSGIFSWRPSEVQGGHTNSIAVVVTDNGSPSLSATQRFNVVVRDTQGDLRLALGQTNVLRGQTSSVPVRLVSGIELGDIRFAVEQPITALTNLSLLPVAPELASATLTPLAANRSQLVFTPQAGQSFLGDASLALLRFTALPAGPSVVLPLQMTNVEVRRIDGTPVNIVRTGDGRVFVVGAEPLLDIHPPLPGSHRLTVYGQPGRAYQILASPAVTGAPWNSVTNFTLTGESQSVQLPAGPGSTFYRAREQ